MPIFDPNSIDRYAMNNIGPSDNMNNSNGTGPIPPSRSNGVGILPYASVLGSNGMDVGSSIYDMMSKGTHEANPLWGGSNAAMLMGKGALTAGTIYAMRKLAEDGHPTAAKYMGYLSSIAPSLTAIHNMRIH